MGQNKNQFRRRQRPYTDRPTDRVEKRQKLLIVCEGEKTEPNYFNSFHVTSMTIEVVGTGCNTLSLVNKAIELNCLDTYDQAWCVFDKDDFPVDDFDNAIMKAVSNGLKVAYSNQSFELWYLLHFEYLNVALNRDDYIKKLEQYLGIRYKKNDSEIYFRLKPNLQIAINNARNLMSLYYNTSPGLNDPSTTVHELVAILIENSRLFENKRSR